MPVLVHFEGGPWHGQQKTYRKNPRIIGCVTDAHAKGMHGVYKTHTATWLEPLDIDQELTAKWMDIPRSAK